MTADAGARHLFLDAGNAQAVAPALTGPQVQRIRLDDSDGDRRLADWLASKEANEITSNWWAVVAYPGVAQKLKGIPDNYEQLLVKNDLNWAAKNRERILAEWGKRYEGKSEAK